MKKFLKNLVKHLTQNTSLLALSIVQVNHQSLFFSEALLQGPAHTSLWRPQFPRLQNGFTEVNGVTRSCYPSSTGCREKDGTEATLVTQGHVCLRNCHTHTFTFMCRNHKFKVAQLDTLSWA